MFFSFSWTSKDLAAAIGIPVDVLNRRINFWISKVGLLGLLYNFFGILLGISTNTFSAWLHLVCEKNIIISCSIRKLLLVCPKQEF